jgi:chitin synthase
MTGSGKSTTLQHITKELLFLSTHTKKEEKMQKQIMGIYTIFESFGTAASPSNEIASCLGQFQTLQFSERGRIMGSSYSICLLDKQRVTRTTQSNFNIFYHLIHGTTTDEKQALHITHSNFNWLKNPQRDQTHDAIAFGNVKAALKICGFKTKTVAQMCQLLAAILHLGNIQFIDANKHHFGAHSILSSPGQESCRIKNKETLVLVAAALGVATSKLETTLTHKLKLIGNEFCTAFLTVDTATQQRESLAQTLYAVLVLWLTDTLNKKMSSDAATVARTISLVDTIGFKYSNERAGYFHDLCLSFYSEKLRQYILDSTSSPMSHHNVECHQDGVWPENSPPSFGSSLALTFYEGTNDNSFALVPFINRESQRFQAYALDATDTHLLSTLFQKKKTFSSKAPHDNDYRALLNPSTPSHSFAINHFHATLDYSIDGFLEGNVDAISPDFIHLFRYSCTNTFVQDLFESGIWMTEKHPRDERTVIKAQLPVCSDVTDNGKTQPMLTQISEGLDRFTKSLESTSISEIIHIRSSSQQPNVFDIDFVRKQLSSLCVVDITRHALMHRHLSYHYSFSAFLSHFRPMIDAYLPEIQDDESKEERTEEEEKLRSKTRILEWRALMEWTDQHLRLGESNVWLSFDIWRLLENQIRSMEKEARQREKERLAAIEAEKEAARQAAIAAALEAEEAEAAQRAQEEAEAAAQAAEIAAIAADRWSSDRNPLDDDCRSDMTNEVYDDRTDADTSYDPTKQSGSQWGDDDDVKGLAEG